MIDLILHYYSKAQPALADGALLNDLLSLSVLEDIVKAKLIPETQLEQFDLIKESISKEIDSLPR